MLVWTRAQYEQLRKQQKVEEEDIPIFHTLGFIIVDEEAVNSTIRDLEQDFKFDRLMEKLLAKQKEKYLLMLAKSGAKLPQEFNMENLKQDAEKSNTQNTDEQNNEDVNKESNRKDRSDKKTHEETRRNYADNPLSNLTQQVQTLQQKIQDMQNGTSSKKYSLEDICPYPFDKNLNMIPFPQHCEIPKYDKYDGRSDPQDHIREFCTMSMEFSHDETYLMRLFPRSLNGQSMEWFSRLPSGIKSFEEIVNKFISQYSYNIRNEITMLDLCNVKLKNDESFMIFLQ